MTRRLDLRRRLAVLRHERYRLLFVATLGSGIGTWMATIALAVDVEDRTNSTWWVSVLFLVTFMPSVVVGLVAGPLVDRLSRKRLVITADVVRLVVFALLPFANDALLVVIGAAIAGVANSFFRPAVLAGVPNLVDEPDLAAATSLLQGVDWVAAAIGPIAGGALVSASGPHVVYLINAATFLFSAALLARIPARYLQSEQGITRGHWRDLADGVAAFRRSRALLIGLVALGFAMVTLGLVNVTEIFLAKRSLHAGAFGYGLLWTATGIGLVAGSVIAGVVLERRSVLDVYPLAFFVWAAGILGAGVSPNVWLAALAMVLAGFANGVAFPMTVIIVQRGTPDALRGRAFTVIISAHNAAVGLAMLAAGALTAAYGARWTYVVGAASLLAGGVSALVLRRGAATQPAVAHEQAA
ncbi:MAG TPA: MFS transporter [Gaiellaceae bacterium]